MPAHAPHLGPCWVWLRSVNSGAGYAQFQFNGQQHRAHRVSYTWMRDPIPDGMVLDHLCRNRICVNPDHLEPVTTLVNTMRGDLPDVTRARFSSRATCSKGHMLTEENIYRVDGRRRCRACIRERAMARYWQRKAAVRAGLVPPPPVKGECRAGHLLDEASTFITADGYRMCRECHRLKTGQWRAGSASSQQKPGGN